MSKTAVVPEQWQNGSFELERPETKNTIFNLKKMIFLKPKQPKTVFPYSNVFSVNAIDQKNSSCTVVWRVYNSCVQVN